MDIFAPIKISGERPAPFGPFHVSWIIAMVIACVLICVFFAKKRSARLDDRIIFIIASVLLLSEIYKQIFLFKAYGYFCWWSFPFQLCSVPMYAGVIAPLLRRGKVKDALYKFICFSSTLAGLTVMLIPESSFRTDYVQMLVHTMLWHVSLVLMGVYLTVAKGCFSDAKSYFKDLSPAFSIFLISVVVAVAMNVVGYKTYFGTDKNVLNQQFSMMYISPYYDAPFAFITNIKNAVPFPVYLLGYIALAWILCTIYFFFICGLKKICAKVKT